MAYLLIIVVYSDAQIALGVWVARRVRGSSDFFVAGRSLGPGLLFATFLAANIGGGSTIGATGLGWLFAFAVAGLQSLLAITGYCLGCRLYFLRWWVPELVTRIWTRGGSKAGGLTGVKISYR